MFKDSASNFQGVGQATEFLNSHPHALREGYIHFYYSTFWISSYPLDTLISYAWLNFSFGISYHRKMTHPCRYIPTSKINSSIINPTQQATSTVFLTKAEEIQRRGIFFLLFLNFLKKNTSKKEKMQLSEAGPEEDLTANGKHTHSWLDAGTWENKYKSCKKIVKFVVGEAGRGWKAWI